MWYRTEIPYFSVSMYDNCRLAIRFNIKFLSLGVSYRYMSNSFLIFYALVAVMLLALSKKFVCAVLEFVREIFR